MVARDMNCARWGLLWIVLLAAPCLVFTSAAWAFNPLAGDYSKADPLDIRIMAYNHGGYFISNTGRDAAFNRILVAINPDLICFEEFASNVTQSTIAARLNSIMPIAAPGWQVHLGLLGGTRNVIASRFPLTLTRTDTIPVSSTRGVTIALADLPNATYPVDVYLLGCHLKCCGTAGGTEDVSRQKSADAIANWLGDARGVSRPSGNNISLPLDTPMLALGDFNLVGGPQPENTLITGNIQDEATYGADVKGDWDITDMGDLMPADPFTGDTFTWQSSGSFPNSRLDRFFYTDHVGIVANKFVLNTNTMTPAALAAAGLQASDTLKTSTSDHLPIVMDLRLATAPGCTTNAQCDDGVFCNGAETCDAQHVCQPGTSVNCSDGIACTLDACNEATDFCDHAPNNAACDNGLYCDGAETCSVTLGCLPGTPVNCSDGIACTADACNEATDSCDHAPNNAACDNGLYCDGAETCSVTLGCQTGAAPCNATSWCNEAGDVCVPYGHGDFDGDGDVDMSDGSDFMQCFGQPAAGGCEPGDMTGADGLVDLNDYILFAAALAGP